MLAMSEGKNAEALRGFDRALEAAPGRIVARRYRAIVLARQGEWEHAIQEINRCLERDSRSAATLYAAACVVARAVDKVGTAANSSQALDLLDALWPRARIRQQPPKIPTLPRSAVFLGSIA